LRNKLATWFAIVRSEVLRATAIARLLSPRTTRTSTSRSALVSCGGGDSAMSHENMTSSSSIRSATRFGGGATRLPRDIGSTLAPAYLPEWACRGRNYWLLDLRKLNRRLAI
jgi:hypothetical protein